jgi:hypothetical protein
MTTATKTPRVRMTFDHTAPPERPSCLHCDLRPGYSRGLCNVCYKQIDVREQYPRTRRRLTSRDPDTIRMVSCAGCDRHLLGESETEWWEGLSLGQQQKLPPVVAKRICGRPACSGCARRVEQGGRL